MRRGVAFTLLVTGAAVVASVVAGATAGAVLLSTGGNATAQAEPPTALALAQAIAQNANVVTDASYVTIPPGAEGSGSPVAVSTQSLGSFPRSGETYAILTTGDADLAGTPDAFAGVDAGGGTVEGRGDTALDITVLKIDLAVPENANCLTFDFRFLSEEYDDFLNSPFNDAFIAELDESDWTTSGSSISAPNNFAFDPQGNVISIKAAGAASMSFAEAAGTVYNGATPRLSASTPITPGTHSLFLSIFDQSDADYDSAVFVDRLVLGTASEGGCQPGATTLSAGIAADKPESTAGGTNGYTLTISNSGSDAATLATISALLPAGFSYVEGSTTGATTNEPTAEGQMLSWTKAEGFPLSGGGNTSLHFDVVVSSTPGTYTAEASASGEGVTVTPSGPSAPITVTEPSGPVDLTAAIAADAAESTTGGTNGYTITISNPNPEQATLTSISAVLPAGFSYVGGSTTGATTADPAGEQTLTWSGTFPVAGDGSTLLHFDVVVSSTPGTYNAEASANGEGITVTSSGPSAPITVTEPEPLSAAIAADQAESVPGATNGYTITVGNPNPEQATLASITAVLPAGFSYVAGSTTGATTANPSADGSTLTWSGSFPVAGGGSTSLHFQVVVSSTPGTYTAEATASGEGVTVTPSGPSAPITVAEPPATGVIESSGPLNLIQISTLLNCDVRHVDDEDPEFFSGTACGTFVALDETLFGPEDVPAGPSPTSFTPVSQTPATGSGTEADPYRVVTVVDLGQTGLRIEQTDSYVVGDESYRTDVVVRNLGGESRSVILYRAGDCYLAGSDDGFGSADPSTGAVACIGTDETGDAPGTRIEQWVPLTPGSAYYEAGYNEVWDRIEALQPFPNTCRCSEPIDNGAGLSWQLTIPSEGSVTASHLTRFSPTGNQPPAQPPAEQPPASANLVLTLSASTSTASVGDPIGFAGNVTNHGPDAALNVTVTGTVSQTVSLTSASTGAGPCAVSGNSFTCSIGTLLPGGSATVTLAGTVVSAGSILATMSTSASQSDPEPSNNSASAAVSAPAAPPGVFLPPAPQELPPPQRGRTVNVTPLFGIVLVNGVRLREGEQIPVGAIVDTRRGRVELQSAHGKAAFKDGLFRIVESRRGTFTELRLLGGNFLGGCGHPARDLSMSKGIETHRKKVVRRLWGNGTGSFRTSGRFSSATVRGTIWLTADRCDGTLTKVVRGRVAVFDNAKRKRVLVGPGGSYLAKAPE